MYDQVISSYFMLRHVKSSNIWLDHVILG